MEHVVFQFIGETVQNATDAFVSPAASRLMLAQQGSIYCRKSNQLATGALWK